MTNNVKDSRPKTTVWKNGANGRTLVTSLQGLPYGTAQTAAIEGFGEALRSGIQKSGSGNNEIVVEVQYTLK